MEIPLLQDITVIFSISLIVIFVCHHIHIPAIVGFLISGIIAGPYGLRLIKSTHEVEALSEVGIVLLLFTIGLEFSFKELFRLKRPVLLGGSLQVLLTIIVTAILAYTLGINLNSAIFLGFLLALSSTAIVLKTLQEKAAIETPHGQNSLAILIFQDIIVVLLMLLTPVLAGSNKNILLTLGTLTLKGIIIFVVVIISIRYIIPKILYQIVRTRNRELFLLCVCTIALIIAWLTSSLELSLGLGAFLAGLIISESEYSLEALSGIRPFRAVFTSFFFISIGMLLNLNLVINKIFLLLSLACGVLILKFLIIFLVSWILRFPFRTAIIVSLALCQVGEFSFILANKGIEYQLLDTNLYQIFLALAIVTMTLTPFLINFAPGLVNIFLKISWLRKFRNSFQPFDQKFNPAKQNLLQNHLIIVGFGENGKLLAHTSKTANIPYLIIEMNAETVRQQRAKGEKVVYGDATSESLLKYACIKKARVLVIAIPDPIATRHIIKTAKKLHPGLHLIARTRFTSEVEALYKLGANEVIPAEFETAVEIFTRTLTHFLVPQNKIKSFVTEVRSNGYKMLRTFSHPHPSSSNLNLPLTNMEIVVFRVEKKSLFEGKAIADIGLSENQDLTLLAIERNKKVLTNIASHTKILEKDLLIILGSPEKIAQITTLFH